MTTLLASFLLNPTDSSATNFHLEDEGSRFLQTWLSASRPFSVNPEKHYLDGSYLCGLK
jgi:hypothetical protein